MCNYGKYASLEWGDQIEVTSHWGAPLRFICWNCELSIRCGKGQNFFTREYAEGEQPPAELYNHTMTGTQDEAAIVEIANHIEVHIEKGHKCHPMVIEYLYSLMKDFCKKERK